MLRNIRMCKIDGVVDGIVYDLEVNCINKVIFFCRD